MISLTDVTRRFGARAAVDGLSAEIAAGEFFAVLGPSGCGKSTLLRLIAGLEPLDAGRIALHGRPVAGPGLAIPPEDRGVGVVFQSYALWPHMTVAGNVGFPLRPADPEAVARHLATVGLTDLAGRKPAALSGGQRQRVALARCLAAGARTILMDEPLANLDPHLRAAMEVELRRLHAEAGATTLYITHDQREAMALAGRIAVMRDGRFDQVAPPETLYAEPATAFVAGFVGRAALIDVEVVRAEGGRAILSDGLPVRCRPGTAPGPATLVVRPEDTRPGEGPVRAIAGATYRGGAWDAEADGLPITTRARPDGRMPVALTGGWVL